MKRIQDLVKEFAGRKHYLLVRYGSRHRSKWMDSVSTVKNERTLLLNHCEACQLISALTATQKLSGNLAELGVAYGASAKLLAQYGGGRTLHLFDTFEGLPEGSKRDNDKFYRGRFSSNFDDVRQYLGDSDRIRFHRGLFPGTAEPLKDEIFSFVHLDADLYESTIAGLRFFYPRMPPGGIIISHDYLVSKGVDSAFAEFFADKPEPVIELTGYQCMVVKVAS